MKSPLRKRLPRELKSEFGKYLVVFIMMAITIGFVSGFLVADGSQLLLRLEISVFDIVFLKADSGTKRRY